MSQLYKLFCEGLHSGSGKGLSSTLTSTPVEDDAEDAEFVAQPPRVPSPATPAARPSDKESPSSSVHGQVGSASTDSPPEERGTRSRARAPGTKPKQPLSTSPKAPSTTRIEEHEDLRTQCPSPQTPASTAKSLPSQQPGILIEKNGNVSPVDFVDRLIASRRRKEALGIRHKQSAQSSSSETDFEGAEEYFKKCTPSTSCSPSKNTRERGSGQRTSRSSKGTSDGSNINLVMESITSSSSESESHHSDSAARCRIFTKFKPAECQQNPKRQTELDNTRSRYTSSIMKGVTAYVEVRSGHDNRSMGVKAQMRILGATVNEKFDKKVTHVVFNEGSPSLLHRAQTQGCCLVSVLWIDACKREGRLVSEDAYPPLNLHIYEKKENCKRTKYRKMKSLQPDFEEGKSEERLNNYVKKLRRQAQHAGASQHSASSVSESSEEEAPEDKLPLTGETCLVPGAKLKTLRIILNRIDDVPDKNLSLSGKKPKRKLMPLHQEIPLSLSLEEFDTGEQTRPEFPYGPAPSTKSKPNSHVRRIVKQISSASQRRRSSCFVRPSQSSGRSQCLKKQGKSQMRTMVCTFMHRKDIDVVAAVLKQLGGWILEPTVSQRTTHVVCGDSKRTVNLLRGIACGCWILHQEWVMRSLEAGHWLDEEPYELNMFPAIQQNRVARETLGVQSEIFQSAGGIFVAKSTKPPRTDLLDLLKLCGAFIVSSARQAKIIIGQYQRRASSSSAVVVNESWVLDSIQENMLLPLRRYCL